MSASPSPGTADYSRGEYSSLPLDDTDLTTPYSAQDYIDVSTKNNIWVSETETDGKYAVHQYKNFTSPHNVCTLNWQGQTDLGAYLSSVYLQIYNRNTASWQTVKINDSALENTDFDMTADIPSLINYKDGNSMIASRIYQRGL